MPSTASSAPSGGGGAVAVGCGQRPGLGDRALPAPFEQRPPHHAAHGRKSDDGDRGADEPPTPPGGHLRLGRARRLAAAIRSSQRIA